MQNSFFVVIFNRKDKVLILRFDIIEEPSANLLNEVWVSFLYIIIITMIFYKIFLYCGKTIQIFPYSLTSITT